MITIIILLILAGISISALTNQGLFARAQEAKDVTEQKTAEENAILNDYLAQMNEILGSGGTEGTGETEETINTIDLETSESAITWTMDETTGEITGGGKTLHVGDYVNYQATVIPAKADELATLNTTLNTYSGATDNAIKNETLTWRILDVQDKKLRLISAEPTTKTINLKGANAYNNAVKLIDDTCKTLYNSTYANNVQNLKIEDIQNHLTYDYTEYSDSYSGVKYGGTREYTGSLFINYPNIFAKEKTGWVDGTQGTELELSEQKDLITGSTQASSKVKVTQTLWHKLMETTDFTNSMYYTLFINNGTKNYSKYWMSTRCVSTSNNSPYFELRCMRDNYLTGDILCMSTAMDNYPFVRSYAFRPVITLNSNVTVRI